MFSKKKKRINELLKKRNILIGLRDKNEWNEITIFYQRWNLLWLVEQFDELIPLALSFETKIKSIKSVFDIQWKSKNKSPHSIFKNINEQKKMMKYPQKP